MSYALAWSGGKDSTLALHRAVRQGRTVTHLLNVYEGGSGRVRFHGVRGSLLDAQAESLGLEIVREAADPTEDASEAGGGFEAAFMRALDRLGGLGVEGIIFGNIHLEDIRAWYEERVHRRGLEHVEPLWGGDPGRLAREFVSLGYRALVVSVLLEEGDTSWLGRELDPALLEDIRQRPGVDPCGERGEFHSFVWDGPLFRHSVEFRRGEIRAREGHRFLDLASTAEGESFGNTGEGPPLASAQESRDGSP